jgi:hypothetical protein
MIRRQRVFDWGVGGGRRIFHLYIGDRKMVWLRGRIGERVRELGGVPQNNLNLEALKFWQRFVLPNHTQKLFQNM